MRLDPLHPTHSAIIEVLAKESDLSVADLHARITALGIDISTQNLYRIVSQMADTGILFREKGKLFLALVWLKEAVHILQTAEATYIDNSDTTLKIPLEDGEYKQYNATSLLAMEPIWDQIMLKVAAQTEATDWYEYDSHAYHILAIPTEELPFYKSLKASSITVHMLIGNTSFLDTHGANILRQAADVVLTDTPPFPKDGHMMLVCGEYIVEVVIPPATTDHLGSFFSGTDRIEHFEVQLYHDVFTMKTPCKVTVRKSAKDAAELSAKIKQYFR